MSYKAAGGMWQFLKWRGREYGLEQSTYHDDRFDPEKATRAAARHLRDLYNMLGDWQLAMAAYNCGPGCVDRAVQRTGYADFWELRNRGVLPKQTANYVPAILAMIIIGKDPAAYGIDNKDPDPPLLYDTVALTASTNLALIADAADRPIADIKDLNPAILKTVAPAGFELRVPKGLGPQVIAALGSVPEDKRMGWRLHRVSRGDTLAAIAQRYKTSANSILAANGKLGDEFFEEAGDGDGQWLLIPGAYREIAPAAKPRSSPKTSSKTRSASRKPAVKRTAKTAAR
jgi:membrane-bound lytic murein transglycosylase D